jgi:hypothetical protein
LEWLMYEGEGEPRPAIEPLFSFFVLFKRKFAKGFSKLLSLFFYFFHKSLITI